MLSWTQNRISLRYLLRGGGGVISIFVFSLIHIACSIPIHHVIAATRVVYNSTYMLQASFTVRFHNGRHRIHSSIAHFIKPYRDSMHLKTGFRKRFYETECTSSFTRRAAAIITWCIGGLWIIMREKQKWILNGLSLTDILVKYDFELRRTKRFWAQENLS